MRFIFVAISVLSILLLPLLPPSAFAQGSLNYLVIKGGFYAPTGDLDDLGFGMGGNGEVAYGRYINSQFALELGVGYFESDGDVSVVPATLNAKGFIVTPSIELFGEVGVGAYFARYDGILNSATLGPITLDDSNAVFGMDFGIGARYNFSKHVYIGAEGKFIATGEAKFQGIASGVPTEVSADLNGFLVTGNLGFRF